MKTEVRMCNERLRQVLNALQGDPLSDFKGIIGRLAAIEQRMDKMEGKIKKLTNIAIGIGIGMIVAGGVFGYISWETILKIVK